MAAPPESIRSRTPQATSSWWPKSHTGPISAHPSPRGYLRGEQGLDRVYLQPAPFYPEHNIEIRSSVRVTELIPGERRVRLEDGTELGYEKLLLVTGGRPRRLRLPGADLPGVFTMRTIDDSDRIRTAAGDATRAVVIGGGFIGSEVAASLAMMGKEVSLVFPEAWLQSRLAPEELGRQLHQFYQQRGVILYPGALVTAMEGTNRVERVVLNDGRTLPADLVVLGVGIDLNTDLARRAGLELDAHGAIVVDEYLRTSDANIYSGGDIAAWQPHVRSATAAGTLDLGPRPRQTGGPEHGRRPGALYRPALVPDGAFRYGYTHLGRPGNVGCGAGPGLRRGRPLCLLPLPEG